MRLVLLLLAIFVAAPTAAQVPGRAAERATGGTTVVIVRHAEKEAEPAADPPLSAAGQARAVALADALADAGVVGIIVTPYERTRATARPLAERLGIQMVEVPVSRNMDAHIAAVADAVRGFGSGTVLVVGHSNTAPMIAEALSGIAQKPMPESEYDRIILVQTGSDPRLITLRF